MSIRARSKKQKTEHQMMAQQRAETLRVLKLYEKYMAELRAQFAGTARVTERDVNLRSNWARDLRELAKLSSDWGRVLDGRSTADVHGRENLPFIRRMISNFRMV